MKIEIVNTGSELMLGRVLNSHQQWLCRQLTGLGLEVERQTTVADTGKAIRLAVEEAISRADLVITTGGLGPTSDDLTRDEIARMLGLKLHQDSAAAANIRRFFEERKRTVLESTLVQAMVPEGAQVLYNHHGTAPGLAIEAPRQGRSPALLIMLPGPPRELYPMFETQVIPLLKARFPQTKTFESLTLKTACLGESAIEEAIAPQLQALVKRGLEIGYCARVMEVEVRLDARGTGARPLITEAEQIVRGLIGPHIFGVADETLEAVVVRLLTTRGQTVALAESCTGGYISHRLTNVPGASKILHASCVTYSNEAKHQLLGVPREMLETHGAVSEPVAKAMAAGARQRLGADFAISATGIAGPEGGSAEKPVGTIFIGLATPTDCQARRLYFPYDRLSFKQAASQHALEALRQALRPA